MPMQPGPGAPFEVVEPQFLLELLMRLLANPSCLEGGGERLQCARRRLHLRDARSGRTERGPASEPGFRGRPARRRRLCASAACGSRGRLKGFGQPFKPVWAKPSMN